MSGPARPPSTFPGTEMPPFESYSPGSVCPQLGGSCSKLAYWLQVRGTMCLEPAWKPQFANGRLSAASENAAYMAALDRGSPCGEKMPMPMAKGGANGPAALGLTEGPQPSEMLMGSFSLSLSRSLLVPFGSRSVDCVSAWVCFAEWIASQMSVVSVGNSAFKGYFQPQFLHRSRGSRSFLKLSQAATQRELRQLVLCRSIPPHHEHSRANPLIENRTTVPLGLFCPRCDASAIHPEPILTHSARLSCRTRLPTFLPTVNALSVELCLSCFSLARVVGSPQFLRRLPISNHNAVHTPKKHNIAKPESVRYV